MTISKCRTLVGFAVKSKKCLFGVDIISESRRVKLVLFSDELSEGSTRKLMNHLTKNHIRHYKLKGSDLSEIVNRTNCKAVGILDPNIAKGIIEDLNQNVN